MAVLLLIIHIKDGPTTSQNSQLTGNHLRLACDVSFGISSINFLAENSTVTFNSLLLCTGEHGGDASHVRQLLSKRIGNSILLLQERGML